MLYGPITKKSLITIADKRPGQAFFGKGARKLSSELGLATLFHINILYIQSVRYCE